MCMSLIMCKCGEFLNIFKLVSLILLIYVDMYLRQTFKKMLSVARKQIEMDQ